MKMAQAGRVLSQVKVWRERRWLTQGELAEKSGVARSTIARAELGGAVSIRNVRALAEALGVTPDDLCGDRPADRTADRTA